MTRSGVPALGFRAKLVMAMMIVVAAVTATTLVVTQRFVERSYTRISRERFAAEADAFATVQEARLAAARAAVLDVARSVRLLAALEEHDVALLYQIAVHELRNVLEPDPDIPGLAPVSFFRVIDADGHVLPPPADAARAGLVDVSPTAPWLRQVAAAGRGAAAERVQDLGYVAPAVGGRRVLHEVIVTPIIDRATKSASGALVVGFPASAAAAATGDHIPSGIWLGRRLYARAGGGAVATHAATAALRDALRARLPRSASVHGGGDFDVALGGAPYRVFYRPLHEESRLPAAYLVGLYSLADARAEQRRLRATVLRLGAVALALGLVASVLLSRSLTVPIRELVAGVGAVERGDLAVRVPVRRRDEIGRLAAAFNEMTEGLALKERYGSVLDVIADKAVAQRLLAGAITLGGELKDVSILFCDVRGFTALTEEMPPQHVIAMMNEHMTALTRVVHAHHGIVDKFVGDAIMAVFGAPATTGADAHAAVEAARGMIAARRRLNATAALPLEIGIGIASGDVVAGCMGSEQRMNYTVLGERVNLAARLCGKAGRMEVLIDEATRARVGDTVGVEALTTMDLKGFRTPVPVYRLLESRPLASAS